MIPEKVVTVLLSVLIVVLVAVVQERSRHLAAIIATMPLTARSPRRSGWRSCSFPAGSDPRRVEGVRLTADGEGGNRRRD
jgi:hypothetical protein